MNSVVEQDIFSTGTGAYNTAVQGEFLNISGERYYAIRNVDKIEPFLISLISPVDHWMFISSNGGLTAGRVSPAMSLFPYITVDKIHASTPHTGSKTIVRVTIDGGDQLWEPFNVGHDERFRVTRNLYKNILGNRLCFEEINEDLQLSFRYSWAMSEEYGFIRESSLRNLADRSRQVEFIDGLQNILPAGTPSMVLANSSNLVNAYKWNELDEPTGLAYLTLYAGIVDRPEPSELLKATTAFCLGLEGRKLLLSSGQLEDFRYGTEIRQEKLRRGVRGAYFAYHSMQIPANGEETWQIVVDVEQIQAEVVELREQLRNPDNLKQRISKSIEKGSNDLAGIIGRADGFQATAEEHVNVHHYANVLFNVLRGGIFNDQYLVPAYDFSRTILSFNRAVYEKNRNLLESLPEWINVNDLQELVVNHGDSQLERLTLEYLPITFGRRHGDPSRPWNQFSINVRDENGNGKLSYQGNWRDIFQNWEALLFSYPEFTESVIAKFVNASTIDGHNPYRITKEGIDWEVEEPDNPWSGIGYWGDHQIIYLLKLLEHSRDLHPRRLRHLLHKTIFCYALVPYRIAAFEDLLENPKSTVSFDEVLADQLDARVSSIGNDGKLLLDGDGEVYLVNLIEKLVVPLMAKLSNLIIDGGIWMNTERPEWNDANNALVGNGLSMVTMYYMRRYILFLRQLLEDQIETYTMSSEVKQWLDDVTNALSHARPMTGNGPVEPGERFRSLAELGEAASRYRLTVYEQRGFSGVVEVSGTDILTMLDDAQAIIDHSISTNRREDGLYHAYNLLNLDDESLQVDRLYAMLEGQVAALSTGVMAPEEVLDVLEALYASTMYCPVRDSFMLYPDRQLPGFLEKNKIPADRLMAIPLARDMLESGDESIVLQDANGCYRFNSSFNNAADLDRALAKPGPKQHADYDFSRRALLDLYEHVFRHQSFTGRSGTMFGFEGLGSIYWHMVSKLMLATQENFFLALEQQVPEQTVQRIGTLYYRVREGIGFNKTPSEYGAFPTDPYSHTPKHSGARQPGMTGQVKEEILTRFGELGIRISKGVISFRPALLRAREFTASNHALRYIDIGGSWITMDLPDKSLGFTLCQCPVVYVLDDNAKPELTIVRDDDSETRYSDLVMPAAEGDELFRRSGKIRRITVTFGTDCLFGE